MALDQRKYRTLFMGDGDYDNEVLGEWKKETLGNPSSFPPSSVLTLTNHVRRIRLGDIHPGPVAEPTEENHSDRVGHADNGDDIRTIRLHETVRDEVLRNVEVGDNKPDEQQQDRHIDEGEFRVEEQREVKDRLEQFHKVIVPFLAEEI